MIETQYIICDPAIRNDIEVVGIKLLPIEEHHLGSIFEAESAGGDLRADVLKLGLDGSIRIMDHYYIVDGGNKKRRQLLSDVLFGWLADKYKSTIDVPGNINNIRFLGELLENAIGSLDGSLIVDFGCGIGLATEVFADRNIELVGVDRCGPMRQIAAKSGMLTESPGAFARRPVESVDGAYSSYVFHLSPSQSSIQLLWSRIRKGGCLVGNFHKGIGVKEISFLVASMGGTIEHCSASDQFSRHGKYVRYRKEQ